jgi:hypothetical protein
VKKCKDYEPIPPPCFLTSSLFIFGGSLLNNLLSSSETILGSTSCSAELPALVPSAPSGLFPGAPAAASLPLAAALLFGLRLGDVRSLTAAISTALLARFWSSFEILPWLPCGEPGPGLRCRTVAPCGAGKLLFLSIASTVFWKRRNSCSARMRVDSRSIVLESSFTAFSISNYFMDISRGQGCIPYFSTSSKCFRCWMMTSLCFSRMAMAMKSANSPLR